MTTKLRTPSTLNVGGTTLGPGQPTIAPEWEYLGSGCSRDVYAISEALVIKVSRNQCDWAGDNLTEAAVWEALDDEDRQYFATIHAVDPEGRWLVMDRCDNPASGYGCRRVSTIAEQKYDIHDVCFSNIRVSNATGEPVATDYAYINRASSRWAGL